MATSIRGFFDIIRASEDPWIGAFPLSDGETVWRFTTVPGEGEPGSDTWDRTEDTPRVVVVESG
jgi:hypothetical protein